VTVHVSESVKVDNDEDVVVIGNNADGFVMLHLGSQAHEIYLDEEEAQAIASALSSAMRRAFAKKPDWGQSYDR